MDALSPLSDFRSTATISSRETKQPVYTTAGTLFDPSTATPIQPPTRRGRTLFFPSPAQPSFDVIESDGFKSGYPIFGRRARSPSLPEKVQQYSPLQQNYDRAVSPSLANSLGHLSSDMTGRASPKIRSGNVPPPPGFWSRLDKQDLPIGTSDAESISSQDALVSSLPVKSLTNLASFPNPNQNAARKVLEKARMPGLAANLPDLTRIATSSPLSYSSTDLARGESVLPTQMCPSQSGLTSGQFSTVEVSSAFGIGRPNRSNISQKGSPQTMRYFNGVEQERYARNTVLLSGPGVPQPLTAGPPGQRQYRPSTLDPMIKALSGIKTKPQDQSDHVAASQTQTLSIGETPTTAAHMHRVALPNMPAARTQVNAPPSSFGRTITAEQHMSSPLPWNARVRDTLNEADARQYYPGGVPLGFSRSTTTISFNWADDYPLHRETAKPFTAEEIAVRNTKINSEWYAGTEFLGRSLQEVQVDADQHAFESTLGTIGEERKLARSHLAEGADSAGRPVDSRLPTDKSTSADVSKHAEPLLLMAYASLLSYTTDDTQRIMSGFEKVDDSLVDRSEKGLQSYFERKKARKTARPKRSKGY
jgi:hypothetical protein